MGKSKLIIPNWFENLSLISSYEKYLLNIHTQMKVDHHKYKLK